MSQSTFDSRDHAGGGAIAPPVALHGDIRFALQTAALLLLTHALAFMVHEYSHAFMAWFLGWKANPLALHYGHLNLSNVLLQQEIDENVNYAPIYASGHGLQATLIALAGPGFGNGVLYIVCAWVLRRQIARMTPVTLLFVFWLALMGCSNLWSYAPIRTITTHADMAFMARGLGISGWTLFPFVVLPACWAGWDFFRHILPLVRTRICAGDLLCQAFITGIACFIFFGFFGSPAIGGDYGNVSAVFSILSLFVCFPVALMLTLSPLRAGSMTPGE